MASFLMLVYALDDKRPVPYAPVTPLPSVTPQAGDSIVYKHLGDQYTGTVLSVVDYFDSPAYRVDGIWISGGQIIGVCEQVRAA